MNWGRLYFGSVVVALGILLLLDNAGTLDAGDVISVWWPVLILGAGLLSFLANPRHWPVALIITAAGGAFLLDTLDVVDVRNVVFPAVIILVGALIIFGRGLGRRTDTGDTVSTFNVFSGSELASHSKEFKGGSVSAMFGGAEIDLTDAHPARDAELDVFTAFGGVEIRVPSGWHVTTSGLPIFGGIENVTAKEALPADAPTLAVNATTLFGGVDIKH